MIEKRKKVTSIVDEENSHADDVEEYEVKRSTFRHNWGYFAVSILVMIVIYVQFLSDNPAQTPIANEEKPHHQHIIVPMKSKEATFDIKSGRWVKPGEAAPPPYQPAPPVVEIEPVQHIQSNEEKQNLRKGAAVAHGLATNEAALQTKVDAQIAKLRHMKFQEHIVMEKSDVAKQEISILQGLLRSLIELQYGPGPYKVEMRLQFPASMEKPGLPQEESIFIEMAPISLVPYSVYNFLEIIRNYQGGVFHRNAGHVLQAQINTGGMQGLAFQEYHPDFPHHQYTMGYAGRPGGPAFYISTVDNVQNHGPASQGSGTEADSCFGKIYPQSIPVVKRMEKQPGRAKPNGFIPDSANHIKILSIKVLNQK